MKKIVLAVFIILCGVIVYVNIRSYDEETSKKILVVQTLFSKTTKDDDLEVRVHLNQSHAIVDADAIKSIHLINETETNKLSIQSFDIEKKSPKTYLNETYQEYAFILRIPELTMDYKMSECYMVVILKNDQKYSLKIGSLSIMFYEDTQKVNIINQYGNNPVSETFLSSITLEYQASEALNVIDVYYAADRFTKIETSYDSLTNTGTIHINVPIESFDYNETALRLIFDNNGTTESITLHTFKYFERMTMSLDESRHMIYVLD